MRKIWGLKQECLELCLQKKLDKISQFSSFVLSLSPLLLVLTKKNTFPICDFNDIKFTQFG
jgi:hypothetical protein